MGKSKHTRFPHQIDTKIADFEGNSLNAGKIKNPDFSGISTSNSLRDPSILDAAAKSTIGKPSNGVVAGGVAQFAGKGAAAAVSNPMAADVAVGDEKSQSLGNDGRPEDSDSVSLGNLRVEDSYSGESNYPSSSAVREKDGPHTASDGDSDDTDVELDEESESDKTPMKVTHLGQQLTMATAKFLSEGGSPMNTLKIGEAALAVDVAFAAAVDEAVAAKLKTIEKHQAVNSVAAVSSGKQLPISRPQQVTSEPNNSAANDEKIAGFHPLNAQSKVVDAVKSWAAIVKTNRTPDDEVFDLSSEEAELDEEDTLPMDEDDCREEDVEKCRLVGVFSSKFPGKNAVQRMVDSWPRYCTYHYHNSGWIIFCFDSENDAMEVLQQGPYLPYGMPLTLKRMPMYFNFSKEDHSVVPIWIQLPNLPLRFWTKKGLSKICSQVGKPLHTDKVTASITAPSFARCLVDVDVSKPLRESLNIKPPKGRKFRQPILYEDKPRYCLNCKRLGHRDTNCKGIDQVIVPLYVPKPRMVNDEKKGKKKKKKQPSNASKQAVEAKGKLNASTGPVSGANASKRAVEVNGKPSASTGPGSGVVEGCSGAAGTSKSAVVSAEHVFGASAGKSDDAVGKSGAIMAHAAAALAQAAAVMAQAGADGAVQGAADDEWTVVRGKKDNKNDTANVHNTPVKGTVKPLMSPGTYDRMDEPHPAKKKKKKNKKKK